MEIPKQIRKRESIYTLEKKYPNFYLYIDKKTGIKMCLDSFDLAGIGIRKQKDRKNKLKLV